jgi:hypothetical protein
MGVMSQNSANQREIQAQDEERREWASCGADYAHFLVQFLRGTRRLPIQQSEIVETQLYLRSNAAEQQALKMVCDEEPRRLLYIEPEQKRALADRDGFLARYADGHPLERSDWVAQIREIPVLVEAREKGDRQMFPQAHYPITKIFSWLFEEKAR